MELPTESISLSESSSSELKGRTVLVTGASKGIGSAIVEALGRAGADVIAHYGSDLAGAQAATSQIPQDRKLLITADLSKPLKMEAKTMQLSLMSIKNYGMKPSLGEVVSMFSFLTLL